MKHADLIRQLTLEEKCGLLSGRDVWTTRPVPRLEVPSAFLSDGPTGLRKQMGEGDHLGLNASEPATCWPTAAAVANSWDPALGEAVGAALGEEALAQKVNMVLGPGLNIKRSPLCGRNFEYFSEDPYLAGKMAAGYIRGIQSKGVSACPKHFAANSQELRRMANDSVVDERTLREIYLTNFEIAVREGRPGAIMSSYNQINEVYTNEDPHLLRDILRDEWGFDGVVVTDWGGSNDHVEGVRAGSTLEMPGTAGDSDRQLAAAVRAGVIDEALVDERVDEILEFALRTDAARKAAGEVKLDVEAHHALSGKAAEQSAVLLKNDGNLLPLAAGARVAVIGDFADTPRYQGAGSSNVNPTKLESARQVLNQFPLEVVGYAAGFERADKPNEELLRAAVELAKKADVVLLYLGLPEISESEGVDRTHMRIPANQVRVLEEVAAVNPRVAVLLAGGSAVEAPWLIHCQALLYGGLGGQAGASALLRIVTGQAEPSGRLSETWPLALEDNPSAAYWPSPCRTSEYREGLYVGYRYYETVEKPVRFVFGYGLSYTEFAYSDLKVSAGAVTFTLTNTGKRRGAEVAQLYVGLPGSQAGRPVRELKGFAKVWLEPGESKTVTIPLDDKAFRYFDTAAGGWRVESGEYRLEIGANCHDIRLAGTLAVEGSGTPAIPPEPYRTGRVAQVSDADFTALLGRELPPARWDESAPLQMNDAIGQMYYAKSALARFAWRVLTKKKQKSEESGVPDLNIQFIYNMPFRGIAKMMNGMVSMEMAEGILVMVNGHFFKGVGQVWRGWRNAAKAAKAEKKAAQG